MTKSSKTKWAEVVENPSYQLWQLVKRANRRGSFVLLFAMLVCAGCERESIDTCDIYDAVLSGQRKNLNYKVLDTTQPPISFEPIVRSYLAREMEGIDSSVLSNFEKVRATRHELSPACLERLNRRVGTVEDERAEGFVEVSAVGLSNDGQQALVYMAYLDAAGEGWFVLVAQIEGSWREVDRVQAWVA